MMIRRRWRSTVQYCPLAKVNDWRRDDVTLGFPGRPTRLGAARRRTSQHCTPGCPAFWAGRGRERRPPAERCRPFTVCHRAAAAAIRPLKPINRHDTHSRAGRGAKGRRSWPGGHGEALREAIVRLPAASQQGARVPNVFFDVQEPGSRWSVSESNWFVQLTITITGAWCSLVRNANWTRQSTKCVLTITH